MIGGGVVVASIGIVLFAKVAAMPEVIKFGKIFFIHVFDESFKFSYNFDLQPIKGQFSGSSNSLCGFATHAKQASFLSRCSIRTCQSSLQ